jgi:hypothetical protein
MPICLNRLTLRPLNVRAAAVAATALAASSASAQVGLHTMGKAAFYDQTAADTQPVTPYTYGAYASILTDYPEDATAASLNGPGSPTVFPVTLVSNGFNAWGEFLGYYDTFADLQTAIPNGAYTFAISGGLLGTVSDDLTLIEPMVVAPAEIPYVTGDGFDRLQNMDPTQDITLSINGFTPDPLATNPSTSIYVYQSCGGGPSDWVISIEPSQTSFTIPANTLLPAHEYGIAVSYINERIDTDTTFGGTGDPRQYWQASTVFLFLVGYDGCLADLNKDTIVDLVDFFDFFNDFDTGGPLADLNGCGGVDLNDFFLFFNAFDANDCGL